eukprot:CAMPEP_0195284610 /NCGR_PEP_ID=MMETSP0707-20130614/2750_1 /TAXON_ID=33640 /ORGANISM="Asterionellopsis glacialis, Strain CCMP134" /LENGTH=387 /DNA_ID=CAMNT_0040343977 /DNA_START=66 /DNA_END=1229 /DNA_ORIENTATION=+
MGKKNNKKSKKLEIHEHDDQQQQEEEEEEIETSEVARMPHPHAEDSDDDSSSDEDEDDDLVLEGVLTRNPEVPSSSDDDDDDDDDDDNEDLSSESEAESDNNDQKQGKAKTSHSQTKKDTNSKKRPLEGNKSKKNDNGKKKKKKKKESEEGGPEIVQVDFTFCDMDEKFFYGLKAQLSGSSPIYASQSSPLADLMIENVAVGTVISTEGDKDGYVYGFASVLNVTKSQDAPCLQHLKGLCLKHCPSQHKVELETVLSGKTNRPAGFLLHSRMVNLPLEITEVLHQQLVLDMDWAVKNAEGGEKVRKSLDFGAFVRLAPTFPSDGSGASVMYKYFDDEIFASNAEYTYTFDAPKTFGSEEKQLCTVIVMTKTGHRAAMKEMKDLVGGS